MAFQHRLDQAALEAVMALTELVDASLLFEFGDEYASIGNIQEPKWRVRTLLMKLESDRKNGTDYFSTKFHAKVESIFSGLPKPKEYGPFTRDDLPLLFTASEVQQFALEQARQQGLQHARRKAIYEKLHPETRQGSKGGWHNNKTENLETDNMSVSSYAADAAKAVGETERTVRTDTWE